MNEENKTVADVLELCLAVDNLENKEFEKYLSLIIDFQKKYEEEEKKLPYHLNLIDELHANENAHSRILAKLLLYTTNKKEYPILSSFINCIFGKKLILYNPTITPEKWRIDIFIEDKDFCIIIENKINGATDQDMQIERYIQKTGYKIENVFVVYLTHNGYTATEKSISQERKKELGNRYQDVSYQKLKDWMQEQVLKNLDHKDTFFKNAIDHYIDHLEGLFNQRKIQENMNKELQQLVAEKLDFQNLTMEEIISKRRDTLQSIEKLPEILKDSFNKIFTDRIKAKLEEDFPKLKNGIEVEFGNVVSINFEYQKEIFKCAIELEDIENENQPIFFGLRKKEEYTYSKNVSKFFIERLSPKAFESTFDSTGTEWWFSWKYTTADNSYSEFKAFVKKVIKALEEEKKSSKLK